MQNELTARKQTLARQTERERQTTLAVQLATQKEIPPTTKKIDIHHAIKLVGEFKVAIENLNKNKLTGISDFKPG